METRAILHAHQSQARRQLDRQSTRLSQFTIIMGIDPRSKSLNELSGCRWREATCRLQYLYLLQRGVHDFSGRSRISRRTVPGGLGIHEFLTTSFVSSIRRRFWQSVCVFPECYSITASLILPTTVRRFQEWNHQFRSLSAKIAPPSDQPLRK
jgi:hypothetical protein